jgi:hypothetical protein
MGSIRWQVFLSGIKKPEIMSRLSNKFKPLWTATATATTSPTMIPVFICYQSTVERTKEGEKEALQQQQQDQRYHRRRDDGRVLVFVRTERSTSLLFATACTVNIALTCRSSTGVPCGQLQPRESVRGGRSGAIAQQWRRNDLRCRSVRFLFRHGVVQWLSAGRRRPWCHPWWVFVPC